MTLYKSAMATNFFATPRVTSDPAVYSGQQRRFGGTFTLGTDHDDADQVLMFPVPTNIAARELLFSTDGGATQGTIDVGLCTVSADGATVTEVDFDLFASDQAIASALTNTDILGEAGTITIDERFMPLWQAAGLSADPGGEFWVIITIDTADVDAATKISLDMVAVQ